MIEPIKKDMSFIYLGRHFNFRMNNQPHMDFLLNEFRNLMNAIDKLPLHPKNKIKLYQQYVLSKIAWHLTIADIPITWVKQNLDTILNSHLRSWLEIPISGTVDLIQLSKGKYGLTIISVSSKFTQCQVTFRKSLRDSNNVDLRHIYTETNTCEAIRGIRQNIETNIVANLTTQKLVITAIWNYADQTLTRKWSKTLDRLPKSIYNFTIRYLNNTLPNYSNTFKWNLSSSANCILCNKNQTLGHVVAGCEASLNEERYNWRHNSILVTIANTISNNCTLYVDLPHFRSPSLITGDASRPDMVIQKGNKLWILELTAGFETNIAINYARKQKRYENLVGNLSMNYETVKFINLSMGSIRVIGKNSNFMAMCKDLEMPENDRNFLINKMINVCIRTTFYIFCCRNKQ